MLMEGSPNSVEMYRKEELQQKLRHGRSLDRLWKRSLGGPKDNLATWSECKEGKTMHKLC